MSEKIKPKFHIGKNGPGPCNATKQDCRLGNHFNNFNEAEIIYSKNFGNNLLGIKKEQTKKFPISLPKLEKVNNRI